MLDVIFHAGAVPFGYVCERTMESEHLEDCMAQRLLPQEPKQPCDRERNESKQSTYCISRSTTTAQNYGSLRGLQGPFREENERTNNTEDEMKSRGNVEKLVEENNQLWREVGRDLRHIADTFTVSNSKTDRSKGSQSGPTSPALVSVTATRCLTASLLALACWKVISSLR
ncbi:uncharacterized protein LOC125046260 [Penaeus chinensis]|uniref:uncharacterized protein LOC125046260 n=1 Tax=Penaeus chinensis TaxID=139456 RepID=UPI001FB677EE|nr:uncharacterized protein LOC125046260 [Penaeus chinensis]